MASKVSSLLFQSGKCLLRNKLQSSVQIKILSRCIQVYSETGAVAAKPEQIRFPVLKSLATVFPFLYLGATLSKNGAAWLEENDIFVPDEDDD